jgi:hypothetical protein
VDQPGLTLQVAARDELALRAGGEPGAGQLVRTLEHAQLLEQAVLAAFTTDHACRRKINRPPGKDALAALARLKGLDPEPAGNVRSLTDYQHHADAATQQAAAR